MVKRPSEGFFIKTVKSVKAFPYASVVSIPGSILPYRVPFEQKSAHCRCKSDSSNNRCDNCNCDKHPKLFEKYTCKTGYECKREEYCNNGKGGHYNGKPYFVCRIYCSFPGSAASLNMPGNILQYHYGIIDYHPYCD